KTTERSKIREVWLSPDGSHLAGAGDGPESGDVLWLWDLRGDEPPRKIAALSPNLTPDNRWFAAFTPDNRFLAHFDGGKTVALHPLRPDDPPRTLTLPFATKRAIGNALAVFGPNNLLAILCH